MTGQNQLNLDDHDQMAAVALAEYQRFAQAHREAMKPETTPEVREAFFNLAVPSLLALLMLQVVSLQRSVARRVEPVTRMPQILHNGRS